MPPSKYDRFSVNPLWPHYVAYAAVLCAVALGIFRFFIIDHGDPLHCIALLNEGTWLDSNYRNWQPDGCMLHNYQSKDTTTCLKSRKVVFLGDSVTRKLFFQFANILDPKLPTSPPDDDQKHSDHLLHPQNGVDVQFFWDPFLNSSHVDEILKPSGQRPAILVVGSGLWYLRYADTSGGLPAWESQIETVLHSLTSARSRVADEIFILPVEDVEPSKLSVERARSMHASDIDAMNSDLYHRVRPPSTNPLGLFDNSPPTLPVSLPLVFNKMLDASQTEDGLHFSDVTVRAQANILLNSHCNDKLPKAFPLDKTCCRRYPWSVTLQVIILGVSVLWGPLIWFLSRRADPAGPLVREEDISALVFSAAVALIYAADRTGFWLKEQKQFDPSTFAFLSLVALGIGLGTVKRADNDLGFLNREQTDEWKGWMQLAILIYHYLGASKISGIYNPIRVLVASYLFMTGYGHTTFYLKKADFGFLRVAQVMVRLNFLTLLLAYTMSTDYISYYFAPLVSLWYLILYGTMALGSQFNDQVPFLIAKIILSMGTVTWFMSEPWLLESLFEFLDRFCGIRWSAREWAFRVNLDLWIVYFGMLAAIAVIKAREHRIMDDPRWPLVLKVASGMSAIALVWFFAFELLQESKFTYNTWHPYVSVIPIAGFVVLRNINAVLRSASSRAFAFIGQCSLETFIIQYHLWLAGDTKGVLLVIPGTRWRPVNFVLTSIVFVYVSHRVAQATGEVTKWICGGPPKTLPTTAPMAAPVRATATNDEESIPLNPADGSRAHKDGDDIAQEPDTPVRPTRRWVDRLADGPSSRATGPASAATRGSRFRVWYGDVEWNPGVKAKLAIGVGTMWLVNLLWPYP